MLSYHFITINLSHAILETFKGIQVLVRDTNHCYFHGHNFHKVSTLSQYWRNPPNCNDFNRNCANFVTFACSIFITMG